jgi:hypothetical protein
LMYLGAIIHLFKQNHLDWSICNMLLIMFDPYFKNMNIIQDYVNNSTTNEVVKYDTIIVYPLNYYKCWYVPKLLDRLKWEYKVKTTEGQGIEARSLACNISRVEGCVGAPR